MLTVFLCSLDSTSCFFDSEKTSLVKSHTKEIDSLADSATGVSSGIDFVESVLVNVLFNLIN